MDEQSRILIERIAARLNAAANGPWTIVRYGKHAAIRGGLHGDDFITGWDGICGENNLVFLAHAKEDVATLVHLCASQTLEIERLCARIADIERATLVDDRCQTCGLLRTTNGLNDMRDSSMLCDCTDESEEPVAGSFGETVLDAGTIEPSTAPIRKVLLG